MGALSLPTIWRRQAVAALLLAVCQLALAQQPGRNARANTVTKTKTAAGPVHTPAPAPAVAPASSTVSAAAAPTAAPAVGVRLDTLNYGDLLARAKERNLPIMLVMQTSNCMDCTALTDSSLQQAAVAEYFNRYFLVQRVSCANAAFKEVCEKAELNNAPGLVFLNEDGALIYSVHGQFSPERLISQGQQAMVKLERAADWRNRYRAGERSAPFLAQYVAHLAGSGQDYKGIYNEFFNTQSKEAWPKRDGWVLFRDFAWTFDHPVTQHVIVNRRFYGQRYTFDSVDAALYRVFEQTLTDASGSPAEEKLIHEMKGTRLNTAEVAVARHQFVKALKTNDKETVRRAIKDYIGEYPGALMEDYYTAADFLLKNFDDKRATNDARRYAQYVSNKAPSAPAFALYAQALYKQGKTKAAKRRAIQARELAVRDGLDLEAFDRLVASM